MSEPVTAEPQAAANSPARQLLAALTRASQDMEKAVSECYEQASKINAELQQAINAQLDEAGEQVEQLAGAHLAGLSAEKDSILSQLTELRQEELKILQSTGRELRQALLEELDMLVTGFNNETSEHLRKFQEQLQETETGNNVNVETTRKNLRERMPGYLGSIRKEIETEKQSLERSHEKYQQDLAEGSRLSHEQVVEHCTELKTRLGAEGEKFLSAVESSAEQLISEQNERLKQRTETFSQLEKSAEERIEKLSEADISYIKTHPENFKKSCSDLSELRVGLHATMVRNLALQYRTEILSAAQDAEDQLQIVRGELQSTLRQYQNQYSEQIENLLAKFKRTATDLANAQEPQTESVSDNQQLLTAVNEQCNSIKKLVADTAREKVTVTEVAMEKSYEEFRINLENVRKNACETMEFTFKANQEELSKLQQSNEEQLAELNQKLEELERSIAEAKELISALDQASLDF